MGIKNLTKCLRKHCPQVFRRIATLDQYSGSRFAIDAPLNYHRLRWRHAADADPQSAARRTVDDFLHQRDALRAHGIEPIYVFDPDLGVDGNVVSAEPQNRVRAKDRERRRRAERRERDRELISEHRARLDERRRLSAMSGHSRKYAAVLDAEERALDRRAGMCVSGEDLRALRLALDDAGAAWAVGNCEGEMACCLLVERGLADVVVTEDQDALPAGARRWLRGFSSLLLRRDERGDDRAAEELRLDQVLAALRMTMPEFVDFAILLGCDFCTTLKGIGPEKALVAIRAHGSIEAILAAPGSVLHRAYADGRPPGFAYEVARDQFRGAWRRVRLSDGTVVEAGRSNDDGPLDGGGAPTGADRPRPSVDVPLATPSLPPRGAGSTGADRRIGPDVRPTTGGRESAIPARKRLRPCANESRDDPPVLPRATDPSAAEDRAARLSDVDDVEDDLARPWSGGWIRVKRRRNAIETMPPACATPVDGPSPGAKAKCVEGA